MKNQFLSGLVITAILFLLTGFLSLSNASDKDKTFNVSKGDKLDVSISNGDIKLNTWDKTQAYIKAYNIDVDDLQKLKIEQQGNKVVVEFKGQNSDDFYLEISIPEQFNLDLGTGGGNINLNGNLTGSVNTSTGGGNISTNSIYGPADISTGGGNIKLMDLGEKLSVSTGGGDVSIGTINGTGKVSTGGGNVSIKDVKNKVEVSTGGGNVSVGSVGGNGEISTGGGNISVGKVSGSAELSTAGGNITLDGATGKVEANTAGGSIKLSSITGSIEANTAGGSITAELFPANTNDKSELNTAGGDIKLVIPSNAKVNIEATVYVGSHASDPDVEKKIKSDFEPTTVDVNSKNLIKKFVLNGGGSSIELNTANGKIQINKK
jgi:hypothetical protein